MGQSKNLHLELQEALHYKNPGHNPGDFKQDLVINHLEKITEYFKNQTTALGEMIKTLDKTNTQTNNN